MHKKIITNQLGTHHRRLTYAGLILLWASGCLWLGFHYFVSSSGELGLGPHPLQIWWLKLHGLAAMGSLIIFGSLMPGHIRKAWQHRNNRGSGGTMVATMIALTLTGYALYYVGGEELRPLISLTHWIWGLAMAPLIVLHILLGKRTRKLASKCDTRTIK